MSSTAEISRSALRLPLKDRAALLDDLFDSIDSELGPERKAEIEKRWADESEARIDAVHCGELKTHDGPQSLKELRNLLRK
jgi:putative addiction module component (TIGR02574 family)